MDRGVGASAAVDFGKFKFLNAFCKVVFEIFPVTIKTALPNSWLLRCNFLALIKLKPSIPVGDPTTYLAHGELG